MHLCAESCRVHEASPLAGGIVDLIALATTYCNGIKGLEGAQAHTGDGHQARHERDQDGLGVVEGHRQVVSHGNHQGVVAAAEAPLTWSRQKKCGLRREQNTWGNDGSLHHGVLTQAVDALFGVDKLDSHVALGLVQVRRPVSGEVDDHRRCHHGMRKVGLNLKEKIRTEPQKLKSVRNDVLTASLL